MLPFTTLNEEMINTCVTKETLNREQACQAEDGKEVAKTLSSAFYSTLAGIRH